MVTLCSVQIFPSDGIALWGERLPQPEKAFFLAQMRQDLVHSIQKSKKIPPPSPKKTRGQNLPRATTLKGGRKSGFGAIDIFQSDLEMQRLMYEC